MAAPKAKESYIIRTLVDIPSLRKKTGDTIPMGTIGMVLEVYLREDTYGYCVEFFGGRDETIVLKDEQFEVIEEYDRPISGLPQPYVLPPRKKHDKEFK